MNKARVATAAIGVSNYVRRRIAVPLAIGYLGLAATGTNLFPPVCAEPLTDIEYRELLRELQRDGDEPWLTIPWKISLLDAQRSAARERKPIFIWAMDGHPLGCT